MNANTWKDHICNFNEILTEISFINSDGQIIQEDIGYKKWLDLAGNIRKNNGVIFFIGNGASASMASHFSADLAKNARLHTQVFSDVSLITAISNDMGYEYVFSEPLRRRATKNDMLIAISSSGKSPNILKAVEFARNNEMATVTLSGMGSDNPLRKLGTLNIYVSGKTYGIVESAHSAILHYWVDLITRDTIAMENPA